jgi:hypothetical protein
VNPLLALALALAAGLAVTRLPLPRLRHSLSLDLVLAAGAPPVLVGLLLGPGLGVLDPTALRALAPVTALGIGWIGAVFGGRAQLEWRFLRRIPPRVWGLAAIQAAAVLVLTVLTARLLTRAVPALATVWHPTLPALLTLAAAAITSGPGAVALVARATGVRASVARVLGRAAMLDTMFGALVFMLALGLYHPRQPFAGALLGSAHWVAVAVAASGGVGVLFLWLSRLHADPRELGLDLLGVMLLGAGVGYAADLSPFVVCALATALIVNVSPRKRQVRAQLHAWEGPIYAVVLIAAGALLDLPTVWLLPAALLLAMVRVVARWAAVRFGREWLNARDLPAHAGLATVAQGAVALALALSFNLIYAGSGTIVTTVLVGVALAQTVAGPLMALALRPAPAEVR